MDSQLAFRWRGDVLVEEVLTLVTVGPYNTARCLSLDKLAAHACATRDSPAHPTSTRIHTNQYLTKSNTQLHLDDHSYSRHCRLLVRSQPALPVLCIHCMVVTFPPMAQWIASSHDIRHLGGARMGVERLSKY